ncbi:Protein yipf5 [Balamuthia mandrillaris]
MMYDASGSPGGQGFWQDSSMGNTDEQTLQFFPSAYGEDSMDGQVGGGEGPQFLSGRSFVETSFEDEPPLLEEIGINFGHIRQKTFAVLNPFSRRLDPEIIGDRDLAGPLMFCLLLGGFLLLTGKIHFGYIYGIGTFGCLSIFIVLNLMSESGIDIYKTTSVLGYCLLPMVLLAGLSLLVSMNSVVGYVLAFLTIAWCTHSAALMFVTLLTMKEQRLLVAYPVGLVYTCFALLTIF